MPCLDDATALSFAEGELDPGSLEEVIEHIGVCESCRVLVAAAAASSTDGMPARGEDEVPRQIGRFRIEGVAGRGAMGTVYRGYDDRLDRPVAIKVIHPELLGSQAHLRLVREARALAKVDHPAVIGVYEVGDVDGSLFVAMEYVDGGTLEAWLSAEPRSPPEILARFIQGGEGLLAAHQAGLVHRDFKPANAMLDERGDVHVTDFGLVSDGGHELVLRTGDPGDLALTQTGVAVGTPAYMSPEQLQARPADPRSDQFSFCVALFEALAGHRPFEAATFAALHEAVMGGRPALPRRPIDGRVHRALLRGLAPQPQDRFPSMRELLDELGRPRRRAWLAWAGGAAVLAIAGIAYAWVPAEEAGAAAEASAPLDDVGASAVEPGPGPEAPSPCTELTARWSEVWSDARRDAIREYEKAKWPERPPKGTKRRLAENWEGIGRVNASLSIDEVRRFGETWRSLVTATCSDGSSPNAASAQLRRRCLEGALERLDAVIENPPARAKFRDAVVDVEDGLPRCATHLVASLGLPDGEARERVDRARARLAEASAARWDLRFEDAATLAQEAIGLGEQAGDPTTLAEAWLEHGRSVAEVEQPDGSKSTERAISSLHEALSFAQQSMHHRILRETSDALAWEYAFRAGDARAARRWLTSAERLDARVEPTELELRRRDLVHARLDRLDDDPAAAVARLDGMLEHELHPTVAQVAVTEWALALVRHEPGAISAMLERFEARYPLEPAVLEAVERVRAVVERN